MNLPAAAGLDLLIEQTEHNRLANRLRLRQIDRQTDPNRQRKHVERVAHTFNRSARRAATYVGSGKHVHFKNVCFILCFFFSFPRVSNLPQLCNSSQISVSVALTEIPFFLLINTFFYLQ